LHQPLPVPVLNSKLEWVSVRLGPVRFGLVWFGPGGVRSPASEPARQPASYDTRTASARPSLWAALGIEPAGPGLTRSRSSAIFDFLMARRFFPIQKLAGEKYLVLSAEACMSKSSQSPH